jgi:hypothetical protein
MNGKIRILLAMSVSALTALMAGCSADVPDLPFAQTYQVISKSDFSFRGRTRVEYNIVSPKAKGREQFAQTAMQAAIDAVQNENAKVSAVYLEASPGMKGQGSAYAIAFYAPDSGGLSGDQGWKWDVKAQENAFTQQQIEIAELWNKNRGDFQTPENYTDEPKLKEFIGNKIGIAAEQIRLPWSERKDYEVK